MVIYSRLISSLWTKCVSCQTLRVGPHLRSHLINFSTRAVTKQQNIGPKTLGFFKPVAFATAFGFVTFSTCAIWDYELHRWKERQRAKFRGWFDDEFDNSEWFGSPWFRNDSKPVPKRGDLRQKANSWWNTLTNGQKTCFVIIATNAAVLAFLRVALISPTLAPLATKYFLLSSTSSLTSLVASTFSHYSLFHFGMNMYVLWSLAPFAHVMGQPQFFAFYTTAGVFANAASIIFRQSPFGKAAAASLGASGCLYAVIGALCIKFPHIEFGIPLLSDILPALHFRAENLWPGLLLFDLTGLLLGFRLFDHVAHMSGLLFGVFYAKIGGEWLWSKRFRHTVIATYKKIKRDV